VAKFKDYLIIDDFSEFLKRYYNIKESLFRLPKYYEYYENFNKIFPNYTALRESKYIYKNIYKKQKMIDLQLELGEPGEPSSEKKIYQNEKSEKEDIIKSNEANHQRQKNKQDIIFNNSIYNSIIKQSEDLYSLIFGIDKKKEDNESSIVDINEITNLIDRYSKMRFNCNKNLGISKIGYNNNAKNQKKNNNKTSLLTKQSTINSSINNKYIKYDKFFLNKNEFIIGLKKSINNKQKTITSCSLFPSNAKKENKNEIINNQKKSPFLNKLIHTIDQSGLKTERKYKHIKLNINSQNSINCIKEKINSKYNIQKEKKTKLLTERRVFHSKYNTLNTESNKKHYINNFINKSKNDYNKNKSSFLNVKSFSKQYNTTKHSKNPSIQKQKYSNKIINISSRKPIKKIADNTIKGKIIKENNKIVNSLKEIKKLMKERKKEKNICQTETNSLSNSRRIFKNKKLSINTNSKKNDNIQKYSFCKTVNSSVDKKPKINKNILFSQKILLNVKKRKQSLLNLPVDKEYRKINKNKIIQICKDMKDLKNNNRNNKIDSKAVNNSINVTNNRKHNDELNDINNSTKFDISNNISSNKTTRMKNHNVILNLGPAKNRIIINIKNNFIFDKIHSSTSRNIETK
jgi:hypothetical protein